MRKPTASNAPAIEIDSPGTHWSCGRSRASTGSLGSGPGGCSGTQGYVLEASPETISGKQVTVDTDAPTVGFRDFARPRWRSASPEGQVRRWARRTSSSTPCSTSTSRRVGVHRAAVDGGRRSVGAPSVSVDDNGNFQVGYTAGNSSEWSPARRTRQPASGGRNGVGRRGWPPRPRRGGAAVWPGQPRGLPVVDVRKVFPDGGMQTASLSAPISGPISSLNIGAAGGGNGSWPTSRAQLDISGRRLHRQGAATDFFAFAPFGWVKPEARCPGTRPPTSSGRSGTRSWTMARPWCAAAPVGYQLKGPGLGNGVHTSGWWPPTAPARRRSARSPSSRSTARRRWCRSALGLTDPRRRPRSSRARARGPQRSRSGTARRPSVREVVHRYRAAGRHLIIVRAPTRPVTTPWTTSGGGPMRRRVAVRCRGRRGRGTGGAGRLHAAGAGLGLPTARPTTASRPRSRPTPTMSCSPGRRQGCPASTARTSPRKIDTVAAGDAGAPSVSANGSHQLHHDRHRPATGSGTQCSSVYVRDMSHRRGKRGLHTGVGVNGSTMGLVYAGSASSDAPAEGPRRPAGSR